MIITTCDLPDKKYHVIDVIFSYGNSQEKFLKTANPLEAYPKVRDALKAEAEKISADAVIGAHFDYRVATKQGCGGNGMVFEVFAYGTAVKFE